MVGELTLAFEGLEPAADPGLTMTVYAAEPGSPSEQALHLLASWAATDASAATNERQSRSSSSSVKPRPPTLLVQTRKGVACGSPSDKNASTNGARSSETT